MVKPRPAADATSVVSGAVDAGGPRTVHDDARSDAYRRIAGHVDRDALHTAIARHGPELLDASLPYVVRLVRWRQVDAARRASRATTLDAAPPLFAAVDDAFERIVRDEHLGRVAAALAHLVEPDAFVIWGAAEGRSDDALARDLHAMGFVKEPPSAVAVRKRRSRALRRLRELLSASVPKEPVPG